MRLIIQRVSSAGVDIGGVNHSKIGRGLLVLAGVEDADEEEDIEWLVQKLVNMRIFSDDQRKMNLSILDIDGELLVVSQFTLHALTKKGNRPSFVKAAHPDKAIPMYEKFLGLLRTQLKTVKSGEFGADMQVSLVNDGPVTIWIDSKNRE